MSQLIITHTPAQAVGERITNIIQDHVGDVVCLLAGGSALEVVDFIQPGKQCFHQDCQTTDKDGAENNTCQKTECRTIFIMGDERVSREPNENNYLQLAARYPDHPVVHQTIPTVPDEGESAKNFATRIEETFLQNLTELKNPKILCVLGVGSDGHTAGIFPMEEAPFRRAYQDDLTYVSIHVEGLTIDSRASFTPNWLLQHTDQLIGFVAGEAKRTILMELNTNDKKLHERPAELLKLHERAVVYTDLELDAE